MENNDFVKTNPARQGDTETLRLQRYMTKFDKMWTFLLCSFDRP